MPGATSTRTLVNWPQLLSAPNRPVASSPMPMPEPLFRHSAETATSPVSEVSLPSAQPGSSRSVWPSPSSSTLFAHGLPGVPPPGVPPPGVMPPGVSDEPPVEGLGEPTGGAGGAGGAGAGPRPSAPNTAAAFPGAALPHSLAASTPARPFTSAEPFSRFDSSPERSLQFGAFPPSSADRIVLTPFARPLTVNAILPEAATPRGRMTATASLPPFTPPATVTPAGAALTF